MSCKVIKMSGHKKMEIFEIGNRLIEEVNAELISTASRKSQDMRVILLNFEKYYFRNGSYASLSVMLTQTNDIQTADIVGSGGGEGLFNFSLGANTEIAQNASMILSKCGLNFSEI